MTNQNKIGQWIWQDLEQTESTNDNAKDFSALANGEKFVISAITQTKGRGRRGRNWVGLEGNLFFSLGCEIPLDKLGQLVFIISLSVATTILKIAPHSDVKLKWPNDVLLKDRKVCGILLEKGEGDYIISGIGVNIKKTPQIEGLLYPAVSLQDVGVDIDRVDFLKLMLNEIDQHFSIWEKQGFAPIKSRWLNLAKGIGEEISVTNEKNTINGIFEGVDDNGLLLLRIGSNVEKIYAGDVFYK